MQGGDQDGGREKNTELPFPSAHIKVTATCCRKGDPFQGLRVGCCLTLGNELSKETHVLPKQETVLGKDTWAETRRIREPSRTALSCGSQSQVLW